MAVIDVVKYNGTSDVFAWKHPNSELSTQTQLIVNETQEAILFKSGVALDIFGPGRHVLETANIPILNKLVNLPYGGRSPFAAEVWYVNKIHSLDIKWGTPTPIQLQDPKYGIYVPVRSFGQFGIQIEDSKKFLMKIVGTLPEYNKNSVKDFFRGIYLTKVKDSISSYLVKKQITVLEINAYLDEISSFLAERITPFFEEYGIKLVNFYVNDINVPENDPSVIKLKEILVKKAEMKILDFDYRQERTFNTLEGAAKNPGSNSSAMMGAGIGLGMGMPIGEIVGKQMGEMKTSMDSSQTNSIHCPKCNASVSKSKNFCPECGFGMKRKCGQCGSPQEIGVKFCTECGNSLIKKCPSCKTAISEDIKFCHGCGFNLKDETRNENES